MLIIRIAIVLFLICGCAGGPLPIEFCLNDGQQPSCSGSETGPAYHLENSQPSDDPDAWVIIEDDVQPAMLDNPLDVDCGEHMFQGILTSQQATSILRQASDLLVGREATSTRIVTDPRATALVRIMTGEVVISPPDLPPEHYKKRKNLREYRDPEWAAGASEPRSKPDALDISQKTAQLILEMVNNNKSTRAITSKYRWFTRKKLPRIKKIAEGTPLETRQERINAFVMAKIRRSRAANRVVREWMLQHWAMDYSRHLDREGLSRTNFRASATWVHNFKTQNRIVSRKITKRTSRIREANNNLTESNRDAFVEIYARESLRFWKRLILNFDQSGFEYEMTSDRTLSFQGERDTVALVDQANKATHSYTIQPLTSRDGRAVGRLLICVQERNGVFGPRVRETVERLERQYGNIRVVASQSGKMSTDLMHIWLNEVLLHAVANEAPGMPAEYEPDPDDDDAPTVLLLGDSWGGNTNPGVVQALADNRTQFRQIPPGTTSMLQPQDVDFFRQWKYFVRRLTQQLAHENRTGEITSREGILNMQSLVWNQFSAASYRDLIRFSWRKLDRSFSASELTTRGKPRRTKQIQFNFGPGALCEEEGCTRPAFVKCAHCGKFLCTAHFLNRTCFHEFEEHDEQDLMLESEEVGENDFDDDFDDDFDFDLIQSSRDTL